ncbi:hypothetical protein QTO34_000715 [Cnephaeus nilssonii]|uniref:Integrase catalytic domain-containing protein n=1 Tax=Cnephaeus nilssonii TaxID=3371016 RepID=A0AA40IC43_CNENI|nr:hypothetical protein QTO34_000715 [Eptesicus nilssonii]
MTSLVDRIFTGFGLHKTIKEVTKACDLCYASTPGGGSLQSDNGPSFVSKITWQVSSALGIQYHFHSSWRPRFLGKVERANQTLNRILAKLCQETSETWVKLLPIALLRLRAAPKANLNLSPVNISGQIPGQDWQIDFTHMPPIKITKYLLTLVSSTLNIQELIHSPIGPNLQRQGQQPPSPPPPPLHAPSFLRPFELIPFEMLYGRPFLTSDILLDTETHELVKYLTNLGQVQKSLTECGNKIMPMPNKNSTSTQISPGDLVLLKTWKEVSPTSQLQPKWKDPY